MRPYRSSAQPSIICFRRAHICPSHAEMTAIGTPCAWMMLAHECRASCNRICLILDLAAQLPPDVAQCVGMVRTPGVVHYDVVSLAYVMRTMRGTRLVVQSLCGLGLVGRGPL